MNKPAIKSVAKAVLLNNLNQVLVLTIGQHTTKPEKSFMPDLPGGQVDPGENQHQAVVREINEETGIVIDQSSLEPVYSKTGLVADGTVSVTKHLFIVRLDNKPDVVLSWEHSAYNWMSLEDFRDTKFKSFYDEAISYCFSSGLLSTDY